MDSPDYIFCRWKGRFWPAKVLMTVGQLLSKNSKLHVKVFGENEQISVKYSDTKPFLMVELHKISEDLDRSTNLKVTDDEIKYRSALHTAMNLLKASSSRETGISQDDSNAATFETCRAAVQVEGENECTSSRKNLVQKEDSDSSMVDEEEAPLKRMLYARAAKHSVCLKISNEPNVQKYTRRKDIGDRRKRRREEDTSTEQGRFPGGKKAVTKIVSLNSSTAVEHKSGESKITRGRFKKPLTSAKERQNFMSPGADKDNKRKESQHPKRPQPTKKCNVQVATNVQQVRSDTEEKESRIKSKYNQLPLPDFSFAETDLLSSELSMESSSPEASAIPDVWPNDDTEEDLQLPVIKLKKDPVSFERGAFVWCKFQRYPYWPSLVKLVQNKHKRASIIFVEECLSDPNAQKQSFHVSFHKLKHYDCPEKQELLAIARKDYGKSVDWCDALICDYRIRLGCGSFSDSFLEYCTSAISYPVRKECCKTKLNFPSICPQMHDSVPDIMESDSHVAEKVLPDRARASRDKANMKLVECIVKSKQAECHLKSILTGKKKSHWLKKFQLSNQRVECLETYIEDEEQVEMIVGYLQTLCAKMSTQSKKLMNGDQTKFILEVMIPEAVIFAISATEGLSYGKAEKKFLQGPLLSKRERKLFEKQILDKKMIKPEEYL